MKLKGSVKKGKQEPRDHHQTQRSPNSLALFATDSLHGGKSKGTTCVVDRDVTAYLVVDRVLRFPTEQYGCRYGGYPGFNDVKVIFLGIFCYFTFRICF